MKVLVTGGAGYIGSVMTKQLLDAGYEVVVLDNLSSGKMEAVDGRAHLVVTDLGNWQEISRLFSRDKFDAVIHFAGVISMGESMKNPGKYFYSNAFNTLNLLEEMVRYGVKKIIFSSTAGVYGNPERTPISEDHPKNPTNPYGESKLAIESILKWYDTVYDCKFMILRYFNAAGASLNGELGENHEPETHIVPLALKSAFNGTTFHLFGDDYPTPDGTCIRDYIHVEDLCSAHLLALRALANGHGSDVYNVGSGEGHSNRQVIRMIEEVTERRLNVSMAKRRDGDVAQLIADPGKIKRELGWEPAYSDLKTIVCSAWEYFKKVEMEK